MFIFRRMPDLENWKRVSVKSIFWDGRQKCVYFAVPTDSDRQEDYWRGYCQTYEDPSGALRAQEWNFFNRGAVMRRWGLKNENNFRYIALLSAHKEWIIFPANVYEIQVSERYDQNQRIAEFLVFISSGGDPLYFQSVIRVKR